MKSIAHILRLVSLLLIAGIFPSGLWSRPDDLPDNSKEVSVREYIAQLRAASALLNGENQPALPAFRASLPGEWAVLTEGQSLRVKTDWLGIAVLAQEKAPQENADLLRTARQRLDALREAAEALASPAARADLDHSRAQVDRILRDREFQGSHEPSWWDKQMARAHAWISRQLDRLFGRMGISAPVGNALAWTLVTLLGLLLSFWAVRSVINAARRAEVDLSRAVPAGKDWRYWAKQARAAAERGDYRAAIHAAYWTAVAQLEESRLLPEDRSRTPRESLRLVQRGHAAYAPLAQLTRRFELIWYGLRLATAEDWDDARKQLEALECLRSSTHAIANS
ncbi:MAG: DUF4129 domain-containing protein [Acidobacteriia bacterium]|nr:DUF4129 domain-containing protein [Terriglobia bacterium]